MFSNLPKELLLNVFFKLHQNDQMECMLVSRDWRNLIESFVLYRTIILYSETSLKKFTAKIQQQPDIADMIEKISISIQSVPLERINKITIIRDSLLYPLNNLKTLHYKIPRNIPEASIDFPWPNKMKYISAYHCYTYLYFNTCPNLTTLRTSENLPKPSLFRAITNMPNLVDLSMNDLFTGLDGFEFIHKHLPHLKSLKICYMTCTRDLEYINIITPASSLTEFMINYVDYRENTNLLSHVNLLGYIRQKYPNLSSFKYNYDSTKLTDTTIQDINDNGWTPFFQTLGSQLKELSVSSYYRDTNDLNNNTYVHHFFNNFFEKLDTFSCKITHLSMEEVDYGSLNKFRISQQTLYIQNLDLQYAECGSFGWLKELSVLQNLKLGYCVHSISNKKIQMSDIVANSPQTLVSLSLVSISLTININYVGESNVKKLALELIDLQNQQNNFIPQFFPRLLKLKIMSCKLQEKTINVPTMTLLDFQYGDKYMENKKCTMLIIKLKNNERRYYQFNHLMFRMELAPKEAFHYQACLPFKSYSEDDFSHTTPDFILICNSVYNVSFPY